MIALYVYFRFLWMLNLFLSLGAGAIKIYKSWGERHTEPDVLMFCHRNIEVSLTQRYKDNK